MAISKVIYKTDPNDSGTVWMDVTDTTAVSASVGNGDYFYGADGQKKQGSYVMPSAVEQATPTISISSSGLITASATQSAGVVSAGTKSATSQLSTQAAQTIYPSTSDQTISSGKYLTGTQTIKGVLLTNLSAGNIKKDVVIKVGDSADDDRITSVTGTYEGGGGTVAAEEKDANFIDYDGTIVYSYTAAEFANLSAMPANPSHTGLTAQGWNWTLSNAKTYVASYGKLWIGQMYVTTSGDTEIDCAFPDDALEPYIFFGINGTATVDWGDGTTPDTVTGTSISTMQYTPHIYAAAGNRTIKISVVSGTIQFNNNSSACAGILSYKNAYTYLRKYAGCITAIRLGTNFTLGNSPFANLINLRHITIPDSVTSIGNNAFYNCYALESLTIPDSVTSIGNNAFQNCYVLESLTIPDSVTSIGTYAFYNCYALESLTIPDSVTSIETQAFYNCYVLESLTIPDGVTSIETQAFCYPYSLTTLTIPSSVETIGNNAFRYAYELSELHFEATTPPTLSNSTVFGGLPSTCTIYVPVGTLSTYTSATNYPSSATYTYVEE